MTTDALVLKHQAISIQSTDQISIALDLFGQNYHICSEQHYKLKLHFENNDPIVYGLIYFNHYAIL